MSGGAVIAVVLITLSVVLTVGPPSDSQLRRLEPVTAARTQPGWALPAVLVCAAVAGMWMVLGPRFLGWVITAGVLVSTSAWLLRRTKIDRQRTRMRVETARTTKTLALLLQAGQIPTHALEDAANDCAALVPVARTGELGGDVVAAFNELGSQPGGAGYRRVSAAWRVSECTGAPIALVLGRVAENLRRERHLAAVVAAELAAARASGRIMALLPFIAIGMGSLVGAKPLDFLFGSPLGQMAFLTGTVLAAGGVVWTEHIARDGEPREARR